MRKWYERCARVQKPGVGALHFHRRWWSPWRVSSMWYQPVGRSVMYQVGELRREALMAAESFEQAMAAIRGAEESPAD